MTAQSSSSDSNSNFIPPTHDYLDERRQATRFLREPGTDYASIVCPESLIGSVEVADESLGGIGLVVDDRRPFYIDQALEIAYAGSIYHARVRHITSRKDGRFLVGILCDY